MYYADYKKQVLQEYKNKLAADPSLLNLSQPSPAKLRKECAIVYDERYQRKDEGTLRTFFEAAVEPSKFLKVIENFSIDKFRPLVKYIKEPDIETAVKNVELLAWLINFEPRPLEHWRKTSGLRKEAPAENELDGNADAGIILPAEEAQAAVAAQPFVERAPVEKEQEVKNDDDGTEQKMNDQLAVVAQPTAEGSVEKQEQIKKDNGDPGRMTETNPLIETSPVKEAQSTTVESFGTSFAPVVSSSPKKSGIRKKTWNFVMLTLLLSSTGIIIYQAKNNNGSDLAMGSSAAGKQCMYWTGDHYEAVPCSRKIDDVSVIALDTVKLRRFKKITRPDTITENDIGRVWYTRINKQLEFYTAYDNHPTQPQFRLKPITGYIIDKYIQHPQSAE